MSRKALFFDIDGTLSSEISNEVPESTKAALKRARALGHLVFVNTGRSYVQIGAIKEMFETDGWLCGCGTYVEAEGKVLYYRAMSEEQRIRVCKAIEEADMDGFLEGHDGCYVKGKESRFPVGMSLRNYTAIASYDWDESCGKVEKFCALADERSHVEVLREALRDEFTVIERGGGFYECVPKGHSKATAIDMILDAYGLTLEDAYVFGDSNNDLSMFEHVPNAILMGKHDKELEPYASFVTKTVEEDGIWFAMETLGLLD